jgi:hypothetical protein
MLRVTTLVAADPVGTASPAVLRVAATPGQLGLLDRVSVATNLQELVRGGQISRAQPTQSCRLDLTRALSRQSQSPANLAQRVQMEARKTKTQLQHHSLTLG